MYLIVRVAVDGGTVYWHTNDELNALVQACYVAYEYASEIESAIERLAFFRQLQQAVGVDNETRREALRKALGLYTQFHAGTEVEIIPVDDYCKSRVLPEEIIDDLDRMIEQCLNPAAEEETELAQQAELERELERQIAMRNGETVVNLFPVENALLDESHPGDTESSITS